MSKYPYRPLVEWMVENKVPDDWADDALILVDEARQEIQVEMFMRHPDGGFMIHGSAGCFTEMRTFPMLTPPPPGLLQAYERMRASLREERSAVAAIERKTLADVIVELQAGGHEDAARWLATRQLANPAPARQLMRFEVEVARAGPRVDGGIPRLTRGCAVLVRENAPLYRPGATIVGKLDWCEWKDGVLWLTGRALPQVVEQFTERSMYPSLDTIAIEWADAPTCSTLSKVEVMSAMVENVAVYPWRNDQIGGPDVGA